uniref:Uncharacterized protein n=1 Tax=Lygus hesperus TaxID=30085 RepID=A0A0K8TGM2_LYGHE
MVFRKHSWNLQKFQVEISKVERRVTRRSSSTDASTFAAILSMSSILFFIMDVGPAVLKHTNPFTHILNVHTSLSINLCKRITWPIPELANPFQTAVARRLRALGTLECACLKESNLK